MVTTKIESAFQRPVRWLDDTVWLMPGLVAGAVVYSAYLAAHPYPAFGAGLFMHMADQVSANGYGLPTTIPGYAEPIPFAYPPLMFYVVAVLRDLLPIGPIAIPRFLPGLVALLYLVPFYRFVAELRGSERLAGLATFLVAVSPPVLQWQISAGGIVRAPATLFMLTGLYTGLKLFRTGSRRWVAPSLVLFALTILTHPVYTVFFVLSYLWMYVSFDRTLPGLGKGAAVGLGGVAVTAPWWLTILHRHGVEQFTGAAGTHGGIGNQLPELVALFAPEVFEVIAPLFGVAPGESVASRSAVLLNVRPDLFNLESAGTILLMGWLAVILGAAFHLLAKRGFRASRDEFFLSGWLILTIVLVSKPRFSFLIGAVVCAVALFEYIVPLANRHLSPVRRRHVEAVGIVVIAVAGLTVGTLYASSQLDTHAGSSSLPQFIDDDDVEAMEWVRENTEPSARFVVMGDAAEWFPHLSERRILVGPWGIEWKGGQAYQEELGRYNRLSTCETAECLNRELDNADAEPEYLYVPTGEYTVRGMETSAPASLRQHLVASSDYRLAFWNEGVMVFESTPSDDATSERVDRAKAAFRTAKANGVADAGSASERTERAKGAIRTARASGAADAATAITSAL